MTAISRRRFLVDLAFAGGALSLIAGIAYAGKEKPKSSATPTNNPSQAPPEPYLGGKPMAPCPTKSIKSPGLRTTPKDTPTPRE